MWLLCFVAVLGFCFALCYDDVNTQFYSRNSLRKSTPNYNETFFPVLNNYQVDATPVTEKQYPWIARLSHSKSSIHPHMCTAACISERIFISAARCIHDLKLRYTSVIYNSHFLAPMAFVVPSTPSKQAFDDIGFIVTTPAEFNGPWKTVELFSDTNRTDGDFDWFRNFDENYGPFQLKAVGYATDKGLNKIMEEQVPYDLSALDVVTDISLCAQTLIIKDRIRGFKVPCYNSCDVKEFRQRKAKCKKYHGVEGGVVFDSRTNKLLGVATWGVFDFLREFEFPVGYAFANSDSFFEDYTCARRIRDDKSLVITKGYYQNLCDNNKKIFFF